jgi:hypothetical protein
MMSLFDENAEILRAIAAGGCDLRTSRSIDFSHVFPDQTSADAFAREAELQGFFTKTEAVEREVDPWDVTASREMAPTCKNITETEENLDILARSHGGRSDGWGLFGS